MNIKNTGISIVFSLFLVFLTTVTVFAQGSFSDANVDYSFDLPSATWKMTVKPSKTSPNVEYVYNDRREAHLEVRKLSAAASDKLSDVIRDEESKLQFYPGYVTGKEETFRGKLSGSIFNFEFVRSGRPQAGRFYFLKVNDTTYYILRFTGARDKLRTIRNETDQIARTFSAK